MKASELREALIKNKLSGKQAADALGISLRMFRYYTSGKYPIPKTVELALESVINKLNTMQESK